MFGFNFHVRGEEMQRPSDSIVANRDLITKEWMLLDSQSTVHIFRNKELLQDIYQVQEGYGVRCYCNGGYQDTNQRGTLPGVGKVWYNEESLANILSFAKISDKYCITIDTDREQAFLVYVGQSVMRFKRSRMGLYYHDIRWGREKCKQDEVKVYREDDEGDHKKGKHTIMIQTVEKNLEGFTPREVKGARLAMKVMRIIGNPSFKDFETIVRFNMIKNNPLQVDDVTNAKKIWGGNTDKIKGSMVRMTPDAVVVDQDKIPIPKIIKTALEGLVMCADIFFVDTVPFLVLYTRKLSFTMVEMIPNRRLVKTVYPSLLRMLKAYQQRGAKVTVLMTDVEFEGLGEQLYEDQRE